MLVVENLLDRSLIEDLRGLMMSVTIDSKRGMSFFFFFKEGSDDFKVDERASRDKGKSET